MREFHILCSRPAIEPVDPVVDKRKSVVKLLATAVCCQWLVQHVPKGLSWSVGIVHKSIGR